MSRPDCAKVAAIAKAKEAGDRWQRAMNAYEADPTPANLAAARCASDELHRADCAIPRDRGRYGGHGWRA